MPTSGPSLSALSKSPSGTHSTWIRQIIYEGLRAYSKAGVQTPSLKPKGFKSSKRNPLIPERLRTKYPTYIYIVVATNYIESKRRLQEWRQRSKGGFVISPCRLLHVAYATIRIQAQDRDFIIFLKEFFAVFQTARYNCTTDPRPGFRDIPSVRGLDCFVVSLVLFSLYGVYIGQRKDGRNGKS